MSWSDAKSLSFNTGSSVLIASDQYKGIVYGKVGQFLPASRCRRRLFLAGDFFDFGDQFGDLEWLAFDLVKTNGVDQVLALNQQT